MLTFIHKICRGDKHDRPVIWSRSRHSYLLTNTSLSLVKFAAEILRCISRQSRVYRAEEEILATLPKSHRTTPTDVWWQTCQILLLLFRDSKYKFNFCGIPLGEKTPIIKCYKTHLSFTCCNWQNYITETILHYR